MAKKEKGQGVKLAIKQAGVGGITKQELNNISKSTGVNNQAVIRRLDQVNQKLKSKDQAGIGLNSGAANMLIKQNSKNPVGMFNQSKGFGTGRIGKALTGMMGTPGFAGIPIKGQVVGARDAVQPQMMIGGTQIRGGGRVAVKGFGQQYAQPTPATEDATTEQVTPTTNNATTQEPVAQAPMTPEEMQEASTLGAGMMAGGGMGAAGANKLGRAKSRLRKLGIYGRGTSLLGRGLQYGNTLNA